MRNTQVQIQILEQTPINKPNLKVKPISALVEHEELNVQSRAIRARGD